MILGLALVISILFGCGAFLLLKRDLIRMAGGVILISNAANLFIVAAGLSRGREPIYPLPPGERISDPVVQALVLTAIVIGFGTVAVLLGLIYRTYTARIARAVDQGEETEGTPVSMPPEDRVAD
ncbi:Na+/H+ antiporter subunit C [Sphaerobacter thermophilus]|uniref:NADH-ubiquinone oxidoreductase chain 4L n=1 Tax=Sphaerobacter thermophilus (strain ATCC 49802 / DSM 20745 / KCCM 41009 / NCIMB 13125 / S 6022) TaxID=479434 RepID=D1C3F2_SPHTD|nr:Na+/H+ antiporter subunit C [Sphaerobacter thermophilus]ACZ38769.1 NADH-ubiquinone oxidoreductase chain 4L [Sphaerobacter thermophilus DSM 20745]PZN67160.1 MAG: Na+/H+ antiporter subunit C [Sphaerobacter thermophilus]